MYGHVDYICSLSYKIIDPYIYKKLKLYPDIKIQSKLRLIYLIKENNLFYMINLII